MASRIELTRAEAILGQASPALLVAALLALFATAPASAARWRIIFRATGPSPPFGNLLRLFFVGLFFNQVLPTGVGGDAVRAWRCRKLGIPLGRAIRSVLLDRASGYLVTLIVYGACLPVLYKILSDVPERVGLLAVFAAGVGGLFLIVLSDFLPERILRLRLLAALAELSQESRRLAANPKRCAGVLGLSVLTVGFPVLAYLLVGRSLGTTLSFATWLMVVPPVTFIQLLPVSFAGWGTREVALVVVLSGFGVAPEAALAVSVLIGLGFVLVGLPGGLLWLTDRDLARPQAKAVPLPNAERSR